MTVNEQLLAYAEQLFASEDAALQDIRAMQRRAGLSQQVELLAGRAIDLLPTLQPGYDAVFVDADKAPLEEYFRMSRASAPSTGWPPRTLGW
jgi:predicted O-methyltransferase YrrM